MLKPPGKAPTAPATKPSPAVKQSVSRAASLAGPAKSAPPPKRAARGKSARPTQRAGTTGGRLTIAVLAGLAIGLVALLIYGMAGPKTPWAFDRPEAKLPSLQSKHTLY
jgi:hypothetical protein